MSQELFELTGKHVRLEPLELRHAEALSEAASASSDAELYRWTFVPHSIEEATEYVKTAIGWREAGTAVPFATVRLSDGAVIGSTRFFDIDRWAWPAEDERHGRLRPDVCEIGYTWLTSSAVRTAANTEAKLLMLAHAFDVWQVLRVCLHTDERNQRSRNAIERIGGKFEGILRSHRLAADHTPRNSARFSILAAEWPDVKHHLTSLLMYT